MIGQHDIHEAAFSGDVRLLHNLLQEGNRDPNEKDHVGQTAMHKAAMNGQTECIRLLVDKGGNVNIGDICGCTPLHYAASNGYLELARHLVEKAHANVAHKTNKGHTPRYMAKSRGQVHMVAFFNEIENKIEGNTWLT